MLIDGEQLTNLMIEHGVGVATLSLHPVKKIDIDYFDESIQEGARRLREDSQMPKVKLDPGESEEIAFCSSVSYNWILRAVIPESTIQMVR